MMSMVRLAGIEICTPRWVVWSFGAQRLTDGSKECGSFFYRSMYSTT